MYSPYRSVHSTGGTEIEMGTKFEVGMEFEVGTKIEKSGTIINAEINVVVNNFFA